MAGEENKVQDGSEEVSQATQDKPISEEGYIINPDGTVSTKKEANQGWDKE